jgi:hypothetical protein
VGIDILVLYEGKPVVAFDLKTGKGFSDKQIGVRKKAFGSSIIQIQVKPLPK